MRLLIYTVNYAPEPISTGKYTGEMGSWLAAQGHDVRVVAAPPFYPAWQVQRGYSAGSYQRERLVREDIWRCPIWIPARPTGIKRILHQVSFAASSFPIMLLQALWRPDVVVLVEPSLFGAPSALLVSRLCGTGSWLHVQDFELDAALGLGMLDGRTRRALYWVEKFLMRRFARVSTITEAMRRRVIGKGVSWDRTRLIPNWANMDTVRPIPQDNEVRQEFGVAPNDVLVLYAGNMGEKQGLELVLEAAYRLRSRTGIRFALVGTGAARAKLEQRAKQHELDNVRFFPIQSSERLPLMLAAGDVHLVVQRREAADLVMPSKLTNIFAAGRPSVATADPGTTLHDVLNKYGCGITTTPGSVEELAEAVLTLAEDVQLRERLGRNAREYAEDYLDKGKILSSFEDKLQALVEEGA